MYKRRKIQDTEGRYARLCAFHILDFSISRETIYMLRVIFSVFRLILYTRHAVSDAIAITIAVLLIVQLRNNPGKAREGYEMIK